MDSKVIGNGLLAKAFSKSKASNCLFFCSGVSNSLEKCENLFHREENLLRKSILENKSKCIVYFSSVLASEINNGYFNHKINMENVVTELSSSYLILRLPQVAGAVLNTTLLPTLTKNIYLGDYFKVYKNASRTIVDIDDIVEVFEILQSESIRNTKVNVCPNYSFNPEYLVQLISHTLDISANYDLVDLGSEQLCIPNNNYSGKIISDFFYKKNNYLEAVVKKYVPQIILLI